MPEPIASRGFSHSFSQSAPVPQTAVKNRAASWVSPAASASARGGIGRDAHRIPLRSGEKHRLDHGKAAPPLRLFHRKAKPHNSPKGKPNDIHSLPVQKILRDAQALVQIAG